MQQKPEPWKRIVAYIIDGVIITFVSLSIVAVTAFMGSFISYVGSLVAATLVLAFALCRDALPIAALNGASPGKMVFGIRAQTMSGQPLDYEASARRNAPLAVGAMTSFLSSLLDFIPILPMIISSLGAIAAIGLAIYELVQMFNDLEHRRWGDRFADTMVMQVGAPVFEGGAGSATSGDPGANTPPPPSGTSTGSAAPPPPPPGASENTAPPPPPPGAPSVADEDTKKNVGPAVPPPPPIRDEKED